MGGDFGQLIDWLGQLGRSFLASPYGGAVTFVAVMAAVVWLLRNSSFVARGWKGLEETVFSNWQLALLGTTGIVLSAASGWTTWDGMRNFTGEPILSAMITFGIQGVMLIVAWLIGESFATGMNQVRTSASRTRSTWAAWLGAVLGVAASLAILFWLLQTFGGITITPRGGVNVAWSRAADIAALVAVGMIIVGLIAFNSRSDIASPYIQSMRIILRTSVLWVMFLACMATSVFFSFDSLFTAIFPQEERVRAADLRAQNQVAGLISDIDETIRTRRLSAAEELFAADTWKSYDAQLARLAAAAQASTAEIEKFFNDQIEARNRLVKDQQERIATSQSTQAGLASKKTSLVEELTRLKSERSTLSSDFTEKQTELDTRARAIDAKRVEAIAEEKGAEGTLKQGRGPEYRRIMDELGQLQAAYKIQEDRVRDAQRRLAATDNRISQLGRELAVIDGDLAKLKGEAQTAEQRIKLAQDQGAEDPAARIDPARVLPAFEAARAEFRQQPDAQRLMKVQQQCTQVVGALMTTEITKSRVRGIDCDPKQVAEAAGVVFALNEGAKVFGASCIGGERLNEHKGADALFGFARKCLADSGLPSRETDQLRTRINFIELNRDDKAHRFVVTWNAFQDGNRLAYLALAIAIAIDSLVFMSGLFGANAVRSPLSDVPSGKARSAQQLEAIIDTALIPHKFETARAVLSAMRPMTLTDGYMARVILDDDDPHADEIRRVLSAGATIGAVRQAEDDPHVHEIRAELFEYLSYVAKREFEANKEHGNLAELERTVSTALLPDIGRNASLVLSFMHPIREQHGFMAEVRLSEVTAQRGTGSEEERSVRNALNAGAMYQRVQRVGDDTGHFFIHGDFYKVLARLRARMLGTSSSRAQIAHDGARPGGRLDQNRPRVAANDAAAQLTDQTARKADTQPPDATAQRVKDWEQHCRRVFYDALNIDRDDAMHRFAEEGVKEAALMAWSELNDLAKSSGQLQRYLTSHRDEQMARLSSAANWLHSEAKGDAPFVDALENIEVEIESQLYVLMLFPENGLIDFIIDQIERAATPDNGLLPGEQLLKDHLVEIRIKLANADLARAETWRGVTEAIRNLAQERSALLRPRRGSA